MDVREGIVEVKLTDVLSNILSSFSLTDLELAREVDVTVLTDPVMVAVSSSVLMEDEPKAADALFSSSASEAKYAC